MEKISCGFDSNKRFGRSDRYAAYSGIKRAIGTRAVRCQKNKYVTVKQF